MKTKSKLTFAAMPRDYAGLCQILTPRRIRDRSDYENTMEVADVMAPSAEEFSQDQEDYYDTLFTLLQFYEAETTKVKKVSPLKLLQNLCEEHAVSGAELSRLFGATSRRLGALILAGEREITAGHARALAKRFHLPAGMFIE